MFKYHIVLYQPEIPPNTGNAGRLAVATDSVLHLIRPLGFSIEAKEVRRAGLDYWKHVQLMEHDSFEAFLQWRAEFESNTPLFLIETVQAQSLYKTKIPNRAIFLFGKETTGLPKTILDQFPNQVYDLPMYSPHIRSLNLANTVSIVLYEAIRQQLV